MQVKWKDGDKSAEFHRLVPAETPQVVYRILAIEDPVRDSSHADSDTITWDPVQHRVFCVHQVRSEDAGPMDYERERT